MIRTTTTDTIRNRERGGKTTAINDLLTYLGEIRRHFTEDKDTIGEDEKDHAISLLTTLLEASLQRELDHLRLDR